MYHLTLPKEFLDEKRGSPTFKRIFHAKKPQLSQLLPNSKSPPPGGLIYLYGWA